MTYGAVGVAAVPPPPSSNEGKGLANQMLLCSGNALMAIMFYLTVLVVSTCGDRMRTKREQAVAAFKAMVRLLLFGIFMGEEIECFLDHLSVRLGLLISLGE